MYRPGQSDGDSDRAFFFLRRFSMSIPTFVFTEQFVRRLHRWMLWLRNVPEKDKNKELLAEFNRFHRSFVAGPNSSDANSVNATMALMLLRSVPFPVDWLNPSLSRPSEIGNELVLSGRYCSHILDD
jgi:hypothetical protein